MLPVGSYTDRFGRFVYSQNGEVYSFKECDEYWMCPESEIEFNAPQDQVDESSSSFYFLDCTEDSEFPGVACQPKSKVDAFRAVA